MAMSHTRASQDDWGVDYTRYGSTSMRSYTNTDSCRGVFRRNGDVIAVSHPVSKLENLTAKEPSIIGRKDAVRDRTSDSLYRDSYRPPTVASIGGSVGKKPLTPYSPNAPRNRLPVRFENEAYPHKRYCKPWAQAGTVSLEDRRGGTDKRRFQSEYQNKYMGLGEMPVGVANPGVMAEKTTWLHHLQAK